MFRARADFFGSAWSWRAPLMAALALFALAGCVVKETRPLPKLEAVQARQQIPDAELLDVSVQAFDTNIPPGLADNEEALDKRRIYPEVRRAESIAVARHQLSGCSASDLEAIRPSDGGNADSPGKKWSR